MLQYILAFFTIFIFLVLFIVKPKIETYIIYVLTVLPLMDTKILPLAYGFVKAFDIITIITFFVLAKNHLEFSKTIKFRQYLVITVLICFLTLISGLNSEFGFVNYYYYYQIFTVIIFIRFLFIFCVDEDKLWKVIKAVKISYIAALIFMTLQLIIGPNFIFYENIGLNVLLIEDIGVIRYQGIFAESQLNGLFLAMISFIFLINRPSTNTRNLYLNYSAFFLGLIYLLLAGSRSAMGGFLLGMFLIFIFSKLKVKIYGVVLASMIILTLFIVVPDNGIFSRSKDLGDDFNFRHSIWIETFDIIQDYPLLGIGLGNFQEFTQKYYQDLYLELTPGNFVYFTQPENGFLKIMVEHGLLVFILFCLLFIIPFVKIFIQALWQPIKKNVIYLAASLVCWLTAFNTVYSLTDYRILLMVATFLFLLNTLLMKKNKI